MKSKSQILVAGSYGQGNIGDEAILGVILAQLQARLPEASLQVVAGSLPTVCNQYGATTLAWDNWTEIAKAARQSDLMILGGGGLFFDYGGFEPEQLLKNGAPDLAHFASFPLLAGMFGKPLMLYAVGTGPLFSDKARAAVRLSGLLSQRVTVRDEESKLVLEELGVEAGRVEVTADPAFSMEVAPPERVQAILAEHGLHPERPLVGVAPLSWNLGITQVEWERHLAETLARFAAEKKAQILLLAFHPGYDDEAVERLRQRLPGNEVCSLRAGYEPADIAGIIGHCDFMIGVRLHSILFSVLTGCPFIALAYAPKVRSLARRVGHEELCLNLNELTQLGPLLTHAWERREELKHDCLHASAALKGLAEKNADLACVLLETAASESVSDPAFRHIIARLIEGRLKDAWQYESEVLSLQAQVGTLWQDGQTLRAQLTAQEAQRTAQEAQLRERDAMLRHLQTELDAIHQARFWRVLSRYWTLRDKLRRSRPNGGDHNT